MVDRVVGVPAHVAVDPVPASVARHLAHAPKGVLLASPSPHADPVGLGPVVSPQALADPPRSLGTSQGLVHPPEAAHIGLATLPAASSAPRCRPSKLCS